MPFLLITNTYPFLPIANVATKLRNKPEYRTVLWLTAIASELSMPILLSHFHPALKPSENDEWNFGEVETLKTFLCASVSTTQIVEDIKSSRGWSCWQR